MKNILKKVVTLVLALALIVAIIPADNAQAATGRTGLKRASNGYYYCYKNGKQVKKTGWVIVNNNMKVKLTSSYKVQYKQLKKGTKTYVSKYVASKKKIVNLDRVYIMLSDKKLHFVSKNGVLIRKKSTVSDKSGNTYLIGKNGVLSRKYMKKAKRLYKYSYAKK